MFNDFGKTGFDTLRAEYLPITFVGSGKQAFVECALM
jgi:hypothetical protein